MTNGRGRRSLLLEGNPQFAKAFTEISKRFSKQARLPPASTRHRKGPGQWLCAEQKPMHTLQGYGNTSVVVSNPRFKQLHFVPLCHLGGA